MVNTWIHDAVIYHIYPLGALGALENTLHASRLLALEDWFQPALAVGANVILLGPVFSSHWHGYDTTDYFQIDPRIGTNADFAHWCDEARKHGFRIILDGVFNHVGRDFWAFQDVIKNGKESQFASWFFLDFTKPGPYDTPFWYKGWDGFYDLVKLNVQNPDLKAHIFHAIKTWIEEYKIDGLRLDAANAIDFPFLQELATHCHNLRSDFWIMGEVIHGDYGQYVQPEILDSVTDYVLYKGLYSSHNDHNYFELAYSLNEQYGPSGLYKDLLLYNFVDNHDVDRIATKLTNIDHLYLLYTLLFTIPGIPSIYYGSEWGIDGHKGNESDKPLRPALIPKEIDPNPLGLLAVIQKLTQIHQHEALKYGVYREIYVDHEQFAFERKTPDEDIIIIVNAATQPSSITLKLQEYIGKKLIDLLNDKQEFLIDSQNAYLPIDPCWARILLVQDR